LQQSHAPDERGITGTVYKHRLPCSRTDYRRADRKDLIMKNFLKIFKTKTFWINAVAGATYIVNDTVLNKMIPPEALVIITTIVNIANRFITTTPVNEK
jgi:hypothetical protein